MRKIFFVFFCFISSSLYGLELANLWRHSEIADKNSVFVDVGAAPLTFADLEFPILPVDVRVEYFPPIPLPFSASVFFKTPNPNFKSFGLRVAYHIDLLDDVTDLYFLYQYDFGHLRNDLLVQYNDTPTPQYWYDFRIGVRRFFGGRVGIGIESAFKFEGIIFLISVKVH
jgi:hypothetical protein